MFPILAQDAAPLVEAGVKRVVCTVGSEHSFSCALIPDGQGDFYIYLSKRRMDLLGLAADDSVQLILEKDTSEYGMEMPPELEEVLAFDEEAKSAFDQLTPGRRRSAIHQVGSAKREETRIERALRLAENLKMGVTDVRQFFKR